MNNRIFLEGGILLHPPPNTHTHTSTLAAITRKRKQCSCGRRRNRNETSHGSARVIQQAKESVSFTTSLPISQNLQVVDGSGVNQDLVSEARGGDLQGGPGMSFSEGSNGQREP